MELDTLPFFPYLLFMPAYCCPISYNYLEFKNTHFILGYYILIQSLCSFIFH